MRSFAVGPTTVVQSLDQMEQRVCPHQCGVLFRVSICRFRPEINDPLERRILEALLQYALPILNGLGSNRKNSGSVGWKMVCRV